MLIISFAWTTPSLLAGAKTRTRRAWQTPYARQFKRGMLCKAYDKSPRFHGRQVATVRLTDDPRRQSTKYMTTDNGFVDPLNTDWFREGIDWMARNGYQPPRRSFGGIDPTNTWRAWFDAWKKADMLMWVVDFELVSVVVE